MAAKKRKNAVARPAPKKVVKAAPKKIAKAKAKPFPPKAKAKAKAKAAPKSKAKAKALLSKPKPKKAAAPVKTKRPKAKAAKASTPKADAKRKTVSASIPMPTPSERAMATISSLPEERSLTDEERDAMSKVSDTARRYIAASGKPPDIVGHIASFLDEVRSGRRDEPKSQDVRLGLGVLWGDQVRAQVGWRWVHLTYPDGFASYALVPDDRAFACFPLNRLPEALRTSGTNTSARVFDSIRENELPTRKENAYLVIG